MIRADLHVHSMHSKHPSEWFLQRIGARESYTPIETIHALARARGNTLVTLTDHNTIDGARILVEQHPEDSILGCELTTYFPETGCKVHVLAYGFDEHQFAVMQRARNDIYNLRDYLRAERIACSVAHASFNIDGRLGPDELEKLIVLFDVFETVNGARGPLYNRAWRAVLNALQPEHVERLCRKHHLDPWGSEPWIKGFTGGSDDHAGLYVGGTYTVAPCATDATTFLRALRAKQVHPGGRYGNHKALAFALYKIAGDLAGQRTNATGQSLLQMMGDLLAEPRRRGLRSWIARRRLRRGTPSHQLLGSLFDDLRTARTGISAHDLDTRVDRAYDAVATLLDRFLSEAVGSAAESMRTADTGGLLQRVSAAIPVAFLSAPFFSTLRMLHHDRGGIQVLRDRLGLDSETGPKRLVWFSDTIADLNGVAVTLRALSVCAHQEQRSFALAVCLTPDEESRHTFPPNVIRLPCLRSFTLPEYNAYTVRLPSVLNALDQIAAFNPDEIVISTPGTVGLIGLLAARLLGVRCVGVYHTDFTRQAEQVLRHAGVAAWVETFTRWFYGRMDEIRVPSEAYRVMLAGRGLDPARMKIFRRGLDADLRRICPEQLEHVRRRWFSPVAPTLLWAGRMGNEKNLDFLLDVFCRARAALPSLRLIMAGDGPERERIASACRDVPGLCLTGRLTSATLRHLYVLADLLVFPSVTDTFGMVVLEAQALGLHSFVTDIGGPQEIVREYGAGTVLPADDPQRWADAIVARLRQTEPRAGTPYAIPPEPMRNGWSEVLDEMMGPASASPVPLSAPHATPSFVRGAAARQVCL